MADKLHFSLVSPIREVFSGEVDSVIAPGSEGEFGVLARHAPFMTTLRNGVVRVVTGDVITMRIYVRGGFADVTPEGLTILAEDARDLADVSAGAVDGELEGLRMRLLSLDSGDTARIALENQIAYLEGMRAALSS